MNPPPPMPPSLQMTRDAEHLKLLAIFHYVMAGLSCLGILMGALYVGMGFFMQNSTAARGAPRPGAPVGPPAEMTWVFVGIGVVIGIISLLVVVGYVAAGRSISARRRRTFCYVMAGISCLSFPLGTVLGIFTIMVLSRPSVERLFAGEVGLTTPQG